MFSEDKKYPDGCEGFEDEYCYVCGCRDIAHDTVYKYFRCRQCGVKWAEACDENVYGGVNGEGANAKPPH